MDCVIWDRRGCIAATYTGPPVDAGRIQVLMMTALTARQSVMQPLSSALSSHLPITAAVDSYLKWFKIISY